MGSICVSLAAIYIGQIDKLILVSPGHVPFEGTLDKKHMTGHSFVTWKGEDIPYIKENFSAYRAMRYSFDSRAGRKVLGMWRTFMDAYEKDEGVLPLEKCGADILMLASTSDEAWPSDYSAHLLEKRLERHNYSKPYKVVLYPHASHLLGIMPSETREKWLYRMIPAIGLVYRQFHTNKQECMDALHASEKEAIDWLKGKELK
jgi:pimeloyl-ACP methyl ester carboxylesterase